MLVSNATNATDKYRAKAYELWLFAEPLTDPDMTLSRLLFFRV